MAENQSKATPAKVLLLFTLLFAGVTAAAWREAGQSELVETVDYPTALGDAEVCPASLQVKGAKFSARLDGQETPVSLEVTSAKANFKSEERLWKAGRDATGAFCIYQRDSADTSLWIKSAPGKYYGVKSLGPAQP